MPFFRIPMLTRSLARLTVIAAAMIVTACAGPGIRPGSDDREHWQLSGKIGLRGPQLAESAYLNWRQCGDNVDIRISGPLGQTVAKIDGHGSQLRLWFEGREPVSTSAPEALMEQQLGWSIPLRALRYWVRGEASASGGKADVQGNPTQPSVLEQDGWRVEYLAYHQNGGTALPAKLKMHHPNSIQATLIVNEWLLGDAACH